MVKKKQTALARKLNKTGLLLCIPAILIVVFAVYALGYALVMSFNSNKAIMAGTYSFVGWNNYIKVFTNKDIRNAVGNTLLYAVFTICIELAIGLVVSAALRKNVRGSGIAKVCIILPMMMAPIASGTIWRWMLTDRYGIINHLLSFLNIEGPIWLADKLAAKVAVLMVSIWTAAPFVILVLLAAISGIDRKSVV